MMDSRNWLVTPELTGKLLSQLVNHRVDWLSNELLS